MNLFQMFKKTLWVTLVTTMFGYALASAITISPAREEVTTEKGQALSKTFLIINDQDTDQTLFTSVEAFDSQGESGTPNFTSSKVGLPSWITVTDKIVVKKGERVTVPYTITVPADADSGGHFAAIFVSTVPPAIDQSQVSVGAKVGMLILLKVAGDIKEGGGVSSFTFKEDKKVYTSIPLDFTYRFANSGNDRVKPAGEITIRNMFGMEKAKINANKNEGNVLPASTRRFDVTYGEGTAPAVSAPFFDHVSYQASNFAFGMYTAELSLSFGNDSTSQSTLRYYMLPWQLISVVTIVFLVIILFLFIALKKYNKWIIKQAQRAAKE